MSFNSISFLIFFIIAFILMNMFSQRYRWIPLLLASLFFYVIIDFRHLILLIVLTLADFYIAIFLDSTSKHHLRKTALLISLTFNFFILFGFKYLNLFNQFAASILSFAGIKIFVANIHLLAPIGISFFTFKKMSYVIDVYRNTIKAERHFGYFALYISCFLEILSGPIDRAGSLIPQLKYPRPLDHRNASYGLLLVLWGLFLKVVVADRLIIYTDAVFNNLQHHYGPSLVIAAYFYAFQIYCDFAGYTCIAIGCGKFMGIDLGPNFNLPYFARSVSDFWRRWHMSLSYWFRDYLYIPLGGNRVSKARRCQNYMIVFLLCGLWHGANWTFVVWGGLHGIYLLVGLVTKDFRVRLINLLKLNDSLLGIIQILITFHLITCAWIIFRVNNFTDLRCFIDHLPVGWPWPFLDHNSMFYGLCGIFVVLLIETMQYRNRISLDLYLNLPIMVRWSCYYVLLFALILVGVDGESAFIYFQF